MSENHYFMSDDEWENGPEFDPDYEEDEPEPIPRPVPANKAIDLPDSKALHEFVKVIHNPTTLKHYVYHLTNYLNWSKCKTYDSLASRDIEKIQEELEDYLEFLQDTMYKSKSFIKLAFAGITLFYAMNNKTLNKTRLSKMVRPVASPHALEAYDNEDIRIFLETVEQSELRNHPKFETTRARLKAMIHILAASGMRIGGMTGLSFRDLRAIETCYSVKVYSGTKDEYVTFLTNQAKHVLDDWLNIRRKQLSDQYSKDARIFDLKDWSLHTSLRDLVNKAGIRIKDGKNYNKPLAHAFRYRFNTIAKSTKGVNPVLVERLMGHSTSIALDASYLKPTIEKLFREYKKLIPHLKIY